MRNSGSVNNDVKYAPIVESNKMVSVFFHLLSTFNLSAHYFSIHSRVVEKMKVVLSYYY